MRFALCAMFFAIGSLFFIPETPAETKLPTYSDSITNDEDEGNLSYPNLVLIEPVRNEIYVIDSQNRFIIYTSDFFPLVTVGKKHGIEAPQGLTVDAEGNIYVAMGVSQNFRKPRVAVLNASLKLVRNIFLEGFANDNLFVPYHLAIDKTGNIYVAGFHFPGVLVFDNSGSLVEIMVPEESGIPVRINNVTIDNGGRIYLVSEEEGHIYVYDEKKTFLFQFGEKGGSSGKLSRPQAAGIDNRNGNIYIVDFMRHTINVYDAKGKYLYEFGGQGWSEGWFQYPRAISIDSAGRILVADTANNRIQVLKTAE